MFIKSGPPKKESKGRWPPSECASMQQVHGADTGTAFHSWPETPLIFSKHRKHFSPSGGRALGIRRTVCDSRSTSRVVFFSSAQKLLERAFTVVVTWPQARATEVCSTAHPHTQSQYIHPLAHSVSPKPSVPWLALTVYSSSQDALRASRLCIGEREVVCSILLLRITISVTQKP